jgi:hypothetical protein
MKNEIFTNDCNTHTQTPEITVSYKHVNFCGVHRPCEKINNEEEYCKIHKHEKTRTWRRALSDLAENVCAIYPIICELCCKKVIPNFNAQTLLIEFRIFVMIASNPTIMMNLNYFWVVRN